ncbi:uncharacterized protein LOC134222277 [Armigeres subalbatus]|uniref:uncharacterized protein LOC134222277 n=1 Tax=Armigeres subalbatus TaxID=124917 RepID=UPI002ED12242
MPSRGAKSGDKGGKGSGKGDKQEAKDSEVVSGKVTGANGSDDVVVVDEPEKTVEGYTCKCCRELDTDDMVQCDRCDGWYHYECVGVTDEVVDQSWSCANCKTATWNQRSKSMSDREPAPESTSKERRSKRDVPKKDVSTNMPVNQLNEKLDLPKTSGSSSRTQRPTKKLFVPSVDGLPIIELEEARSEVSCSSSQRSARNRAKLQLQRLEEERVFEQQQADQQRLREQQEAEKHKSFMDRKYKLLQAKEDQVRAPAVYTLRDACRIG